MQSPSWWMRSSWRKNREKEPLSARPKLIMRSPNFTMMCVTNHKVPSSKIIKIVKQPASERDIRELNLVPDEEVIYLLRLLFADGEPVMVEHNFFPERFSKLLETDLADTSLYAFCGINTVFILAGHQSRFRLRNRRRWRQSFWVFLFPPQ